MITTLFALAPLVGSASDGLVPASAPFAAAFTGSGFARLVQDDERPPASVSAVPS